MTEYEFNEEQNKIIKGVATRCIVQAILLALGGVFGIIGTAFLTNFSAISPALSIVLFIQSSLFIAMGIAFYPPSANFKRVATTEGSDLTEVMKGLKKLNWGFKLLITLILGSIGCDIIIILLS